MKSFQNINILIKVKLFCLKNGKKLLFERKMRFRKQKIKKLVLKKTTLSYEKNFGNLVLPVAHKSPGA